MQIVRESVVVDDATEFRLINAHDAVITFIQQFGPMDRFPPSLVAAAFAHQYFAWHTQSDLSIDTAAFRATFGRCPLRIFVERGDLISKKVSSFAPRMGDERFGLGQFQFEFILQERFDLLFDLFGLCLWPYKTEQEVICVATVSEATKVWVVWVLRWHLLKLPSQLPRFLASSLFVPFMGLTDESAVGWVLLPYCTFGVSGDKDGFYEPVQFVEQYV